MTAPPAGPRRRWYLRPQLVLPAVIALIVGVALLTPEAMSGRRGDARLTTHSTTSQGARLLYELAARLGWRVERWSESNLLPSDPGAVVAVLDPVEPLSAIETHRVLDHVRAGGALLYVMNGRSPLNDSLHLRRALFGGEYVPTEAGAADVSRSTRNRPGGSPSDSTSPASDSVPTAAADSTPAVAPTDSAEAAAATATLECANAEPRGSALPMWGDQRMVLYQFDWTGPRPAGTIVFARAELDPQGRDSVRRRATTAAAGFPLGRGRVVVISDPDFLRNDVLRVCSWGVDVVAVRMLEYLSDAGAVRRDRIVFDEYHQGYGPHPGTFRAIAMYLARAPSGHVLVQALVAGLVLLLALGPRALPPRDTERVERRSPLEHVSALANAYARVGATRTATVRLLRGVRRRVERAARDFGGRAAEASDEDFLEAAGRGAPALAEDVALIRRALTSGLSRREFEAVGGALRRLEASSLSLGR